MATYNIFRANNIRKKRVKKKHKKMCGKYFSHFKERKSVYRTKKDLKAVAAAKKILRLTDCCSLWDGYTNKDNICFDYYDMKFLLAIIRKALADDFSLEDYYFGEMPISNVAYFTHKSDYDNYRLHKNNNSIREIAFMRNDESLYAIDKLNEIADVADKIEDAIDNGVLDKSEQSQER